VEEVPEPIVAFWLHVFHVVADAGSGIFAEA
jgi:hypothetical protein